MKMFTTNVPQEKRREMIQEIQNYFLEERDEVIGEIAAEAFWEFIRDRFGPVFYNLAIKDARDIVEQRMQTLEEDLYALEKQQ